MSARIVCDHGREWGSPCAECEAEGAAWRARVQGGDEPCPVCEGRCHTLRALRAAQAALVHERARVDALAPFMAAALLRQGIHATHETCEACGGGGVVPGWAERLDEPPDACPACAGLGQVLLDAPVPFIDRAALRAVADEEEDDEDDM